MTQVWAIWFGGVNYSQPEIPADVELFTSISAARTALVDRARVGNWYPQTFPYVNREAVSVLTPCADEGAQMWLYFADPSDSNDPYPDRIVSFTESGGIRTEQA